jgi:hypothetical protein
MAQVTMEHNKLIPGLPNEIAHQIIYKLSCFDLFCLQGISKTWKDFIECERKTGRTMFRLPRKFSEHPDTAIRPNFIGELWKDPYNRQNNNEGNLWDVVRSNPLFDLSKDIRNLEDHESTLGFELVWREGLEKWEDMAQHSDKQASWRSMMLTYPPVTGVFLTIEWTKHSIPRGLNPEKSTRKFVVSDAEGITLGDVISVVVEPPSGAGLYRYCSRALMRLWPRWALWEEECGGPEALKHGETDDELLARMSHWSHFEEPTVLYASNEKIIQWAVRACS